uniref:protein disulfide-isomerase n=1 Tax=Albugo laibachii Nc14 TaxID=890382 RepID=F0W2P2_9STRA|nr:SSP8 [Albugo laibachii Nc14]|eukprot:CCA15328.1 SSP8 [Albugo laibachii Nc14]
MQSRVTDMTDRNDNCYEWECATWLVLRRALSHNSKRNKHSMLPLQLVPLFCVVPFALASDVVDLTPDNFDKSVDGSSHVLVEFYAPWCGHCKKLSPLYEIVGTSFKTVEDVVVAKVNADSHGELRDKYGVSGFPTLKYFPKGSTEAEEYSGGRSEDDFIAFLNDKSGSNVKAAKPPSFVPALTASTFESQVFESGRHAVVEFYAPWCGHCMSLVPIYEKLAEVFQAEDNVLIAKVDATAEQSLGTAYDVKGYPTIKYFAPHSRTPEDYSEGRDLTSFVNFINEKAGTYRNEDGSLASIAGRVTELDVLASGVTEFTNSHLEQAEAIVEKLEGEDSKHGNLYIKAIRKIIAKGSGYIQTEINRLDRLLKNKNAPLGKRKLFESRKNILKALSGEVIDTQEDDDSEDEADE